MPRQPRQRSETGIYHVMLRGINRQPIFNEDADYRRFLDCLKLTINLSEATVFAYVLMPNHVHLLLAEGREPISTTIKRLTVRYAGWFNWKNGRVGHLFQDRFRSRAVEDDMYFLTVLQYIHFNPVKAEMTARPADYPWSSRATWGSATSLVDLAQLEKIVSVATVKELEAKHNPSLEASDGLLSNKEAPGRLTDDEARRLMQALTGVQNASAFGSLPPNVQRKVATDLADHGVPILQISRLTGIDRGHIYRWRTS